MVTAVPAREEPARASVTTPPATNTARVAIPSPDNAPSRAVAAPAAVGRKPVDLEASPSHVWSAPGAPAPPPPATTPAAVEKRSFRLGTIINYIPEVMLYRALAPKIRELLTKQPAEPVLPPGR